MSQREPRTKKQLVDRLTAAMVALPWTPVGPYEMPKEPVPTWGMHCMELPDAVVYASTEAECRAEWGDMLTAYLMAYVASGELPPAFPSGFRYGNSDTAGCGATVALPWNGGA